MRENLKAVLIHYEYCAALLSLSSIIDCCTISFTNLVNLAGALRGHLPPHQKTP
jgi:hypothetical protein